MCCNTSSAKNPNHLLIVNFCFQTLKDVCSLLPHAHLPTLVVSAVSMVFLIVAKELNSFLSAKLPVPIPVELITVSWCEDTLPGLSLPLYSVLLLLQRWGEKKTPQTQWKKAADTAAALQPLLCADHSKTEIFTANNYVCTEHKVDQSIDDLRVWNVFQICGFFLIH